LSEAKSSLRDAFDFAFDSIFAFSLFTFAFNAFALNAFSPFCHLSFVI